MRAIFQPSRHLRGDREESRGQESQSREQEGTMKRKTKKRDFKKKKKKKEGNGRSFVAWLAVVLFAARNRGTPFLYLLIDTHTPRRGGSQTYRTVRRACFNFALAATRARIARDYASLPPPLFPSSASL